MLVCHHISAVLVAGSTLIAVSRPPAESLPTLRELGFMHVELAYYEGWTAVGAGECGDPRQLEVIRRGLAGLTAIAVNVGVEGLSPKAATSAVLDGLSLARALEIGLVTLQAEAALDLAALVRVAQRARITLAVETHLGYVTESPEAARRLLDDVPGLRLTLDPSHFAFLGRSLDEPEIAALFGVAGHLHYRDASEGVLQVSPGAGAIDPASFVERLNDACYAGAVTVEYIDAPDEAAAARLALENVTASLA